MENRWEHLDDEYADEKPFVKIRTTTKTEESFIEKPTKAEKKGRRMARQMKEYHVTPEEPDDRN